MLIYAACFVFTIFLNGFFRLRACQKANKYIGRFDKKGQVVIVSKCKTEF